MRIIVWIAILFGVTVFITLYAWVLLRGFLDRYSIIDSPEALTEFKVMVRKLMFLALGQIVAMIPVIILATVAGATKKFTATEFTIFLLLMGSGIVLGYWVKKFEKKASSLPVNPDYPDLESQYRAVCHAWIKKALPDF